jgi:hypothetical protein
LIAPGREPVGRNKHATIHCATPALFPQDRAGDVAAAGSVRRACSRWSLLRATGYGLHVYKEEDKKNHAMNSASYNLAIEKPGPSELEGPGSIVAGS